MDQAGRRVVARDRWSCAGVGPSAGRDRTSGTEQEGSRTAPLCQQRRVLLAVRDVFCLVEQVLVEGFVGVEDFDADEAAVFPVEDRGAVSVLGCAADDGVASGVEDVVGEVDVGGVGVPVVGDSHSVIVPWWSVRSWR